MTKQAAIACLTQWNDKKLWSFVRLGSELGGFFKLEDLALQSLLHWHLGLQVEVVAGPVPWSALRMIRQHSIACNK